MEAGMRASERKRGRSGPGQASHPHREAVREAPGQTQPRHSARQAPRLGEPEDRAQEGLVWPLVPERRADRDARHRVLLVAEEERLMWSYLPADMSLILIEWA